MCASEGPSELAHELTKMHQTKSAAEAAATAGSARALGGLTSLHWGFPPRSSYVRYASKTNRTDLEPGPRPRRDMRHPGPIKFTPAELHGNGELCQLVCDQLTFRPPSFSEAHPTTPSHDRSKTLLLCWPILVGPTTPSPFRRASP
jgi:hypothetical protein